MEQKPGRLNDESKVKKLELERGDGFKVNVFAVHVTQRDVGFACI